MGVGARHFLGGTAAPLEHLLDRFDPVGLSVAVGHVLQNFLFLQRAFGVLLGALLNLEGVQLLVLELEREPHS